MPTDDDIKKKAKELEDKVARKRGNANGAGTTAIAAKQPLHDWDSPDWSILDDRRGELPDFPLDCLPVSIRAWVKRAARGAGVTAAHVAVPALGITSSLVGTARRIKATRSWIEPMSCWAAVVGPSGSGKTPGIDAIKRTLDQIERNNCSEVAALQDKHETKAEAARAARAQWKKKIEDATEVGGPTPEMPATARDPGKFVAPRLHVSDGTIERFGELLQARPQGILRLMDELSAMFTNMSRYSGGQDNEFWLEAWNGGAYVVERIGRALHIDHLLIGVVGGMQPDKLAQSFEGPADGMYARLLFAWPPEADYKSLSDDALEIDTELQNALKRLNGAAEFVDGKVVDRPITLSDEARAEFEQYRKRVHAQKQGYDGREREWLAKAQAHALRLAGTLCLLDWAWGLSPSPPTEVDRGYMKSAVRLVQDYFWPHARAALRQIGLSDRHINARRVLRWIKANRRPGQDISREDIRRDALGQRLDAERISELLAAIARAGWVREQEGPKSGPQGGRPAHRWEANPILWTSAAQTGEEVSAVSAVSATGNENGIESEKEAASKAKPLSRLSNGKKGNFSSASGGYSDSTAETAETAETSPKAVRTEKHQPGNGKGAPESGHVCEHCGLLGSPSLGRVDEYTLGDDSKVKLHLRCTEIWLDKEDAGLHL
jgi:hypothetical protein